MISPSRFPLLMAGVLLAMTPGHITPAHASINDDMQQMFDAMGVVGNVTEPGAFRGQTRNLYTGGSLSMRVPQRNYQLFTMSGPSFKAGCGGIDLFGGSFSFINSEQLVAMLQNIGSVAVTQAFLLALDSISPEIAKNLKEMQNWMQKFNSMSVNSCEAGQALAYGMFGRVNEAKSHACRSVRSSSGDAPDYAKGWFDCNSSGPGSTLSTARDADPATKKLLFTEGNIAWRALQSINGIDNATREMLMSFSGTYILQKTGAGVNEQPSFVPVRPTLTRIGQFVDGLGTEDANGNITLSLLSCGSDTTDCMSPVATSVSVKSFRKRVSEAMHSLADAMLGRTATTADHIRLINSSRLPVKRMLDVTTQVDAATAYSTIMAWEDAVAWERAKEFLIQGISDVRRMLKPGLISDIEKTELDKLDKDLADRLALVNAEAQHMLTKEQASYQVAGYLEQMNKAMWAGAPQTLRGVLLFTGGL